MAGGGRHGVAGGDILLGEKTGCSIGFGLWGLSNGERFTLGLRSVASWERQTGVKAYVMQVRWVVRWLVLFLSFTFCARESH